MDERPFEFVYNAIKQRPHLLNIINNNYLYCLNDPEFTIRRLYDIIGDILKRLKQLKIHENNQNGIVVRNVAMGISAGTVDFKNYLNWTKAHDKKMMNKENVKNQV